MEILNACIAEPAGTGCRATVVYERCTFPEGWWAGCWHR
jgi:hypothetical protein